MAQKRGKFIVLDGPDGSGKTTQAKILAEEIHRLGRRVVLTREPGGTAVGERIRRILLDPNEERLSAWAELFLYLASRAQLVEEVIRPAIERGDVVVCERFHLATVAYQGYARGLGMNRLLRLGRTLFSKVKPDLTIILDVPPELGLKRRGGTLDRIEKSSIQFHRKVRSGFLLLAGMYPDKVKVVRTTAPVRTVSQKILTLVKDVL